MMVELEEPELADKRKTIRRQQDRKEWKTGKAILIFCAGVIVGAIFNQWVTKNVTQTVYVNQTDRRAK